MTAQGLPSRRIAQAIPASTEWVRRVLRTAAVRGTLAPSIHNTQPWRFVLAGDHLDVYADWDRQLRVLDPRGRQLLISCGCALFNVQVAIEAAGYDAYIQRFPDPRTPALLARVSVGAAHYGRSVRRHLNAAIDERRTNRRRFADEPVPAAFVQSLISAARAEGAELVPVAEREQRAAVAELTRLADRIELEDPAYRAELRAWTTDDPRRPDGVAAATVPYAGTGSHNADALPIRAFDTTGMGWLPAQSNSGTDQCLLLLGTVRDGPAAWLAAGEALERVLLQITREAFAASPLTQIVEVAHTNRLLRSELQLTIHPHVLLRVGKAPETVPSRRRRLVEVLTEQL